MNSLGEEPSSSPPANGRLVVDTREPPDVKKLSKDAAMDREIDYTTDNLGAGDFLTGTYLVERKRYSDFVGRLTSHDVDIWTQVRALDAAAEELGLVPVLLLEGAWDSRNLRGTSDNAVFGAKAAIHKMGIRHYHALDKDETAYAVAKMAEMSSSDAKAHSVRSSPSVPEADRPQHLIEGLPNVGPKTARTLLRRFVTARGVFNATKDELQEVDGVGPKTAENIDSALIDVQRS